MLFSACNAVNAQSAADKHTVKQHLKVRLLQGLISSTAENLSCDFKWLPACVPKQLAQATAQATAHSMCHYM